MRANVDSSRLVTVDRVVEKLGGGVSYRKWFVAGEPILWLPTIALS